MNSLFQDPPKGIWSHCECCGKTAYSEAIACCDNGCGSCKSCWRSEYMFVWQSEHITEFLQCPICHSRVDFSEEYGDDNQTA